jgi:ribosome-binding factor A
MTRGKRAGRTASQRQLRVGEELRHALAEVLARGEVRDPDLHDVAITVTEVQVSPDLRQATAYVMPLGGRNVETVVAALNRGAGWLSGQVGHMVHLKFTPRFRFAEDMSFDAAGRVEAILRDPAVAADLRDGDGGEDGSHGGGSQGGA